MSSESKDSIHIEDVTKEDIKFDFEETAPYNQIEVKERLQRESDLDNETVYVAKAT